jgi:hypothetical protein
MRYIKQNQSGIAKSESFDQINHDDATLLPVAPCDVATHHFGRCERKLPTNFLPTDQATDETGH